MLEESIKRLLDEIGRTEFYGFWMPDSRNSVRKRPIKIRRLEVGEIGLEGRTYYFNNLYPSLTLKDKDTKEEFKFPGGYGLDGWCFYLSKETLTERLEDLENFWMRGYDQKVRSLNQEIKTERTRLENLIRKREQFENGITEYQKKLHELLWKNF